MGRRTHPTDVEDVQSALRELGRVRFGSRKEPNRPGSPLQYPRLSSTSRARIERIASLFGGTVQEWQKTEGGAPEYDVVIESPLPIVAPPPGIRPWSRSYELWTGGICQRRCTGVHALTRGPRGRWIPAPVQTGTSRDLDEPSCICGVDTEPEDRDCRLTLRFSFLILGLGTAGQWRAETHSYNAAREIPPLLELMQRRKAPGWLKMVKREDLTLDYDEKKKEVRPLRRRFPVPVIDTEISEDELLELERPASMVAIGAGVPQIEAGDGPVPYDEGALDGSPIEPPPPPPEVPADDYATASAHAAGVPEEPVDEEPVDEEEDPLAKARRMHEQAPPPDPDQESTS